MKTFEFTFMHVADGNNEEEAKQQAAIEIAETAQKGLLEPIKVELLEDTKEIESPHKPIQAANTAPLFKLGNWHEYWVEIYPDDKKPDNKPVARLQRIDINQQASKDFPPELLAYINNSSKVVEALKLLVLLIETDYAAFDDMDEWHKAVEVLNLLGVKD